MKHILIAGGTGFIGEFLVKELEKHGHSVMVLSRSKSRKPKIVQWNPTENMFPLDELKDIQVIINLCGAGIADKRWSKSRKKELISSRVDITNSLFLLGKQLPNLEHYISASGINAYGYDDGSIIHSEMDAFGDDFVSQLVKKWENAADSFSELVPVVKLRIAVVLSKDGGALDKMKLPLKLGVKGVLGDGKQAMPWIHMNDLVSMFRFAVEEKLEGVYNTNAGNSTNQEFMTELANSMNRKTWLSAVPSFIIKLMLGESSALVLRGAKASNEKIKNKGFIYRFDSLDKALQDFI